MLAEAYARPRRAAPAARARPRPPRRARGDHAGARRRADQHRGLRAPPRVARARRHADAARRGRGRGGAGRGAPGGAGLRRRGLAGARRNEESSRPARSSGTSPCRETSRSRHRAVLLGAIAEGETRVRGFGRAADTESAIAAARALGVEVEDVATDELVVHGVGLRGLAPPDEPIDCGNAGTLMRLLTGHRSPASHGRFELVGDESLSLAADGPDRRAAARGWARASRRPTACRRCRSRADACSAIRYELPVASAQVKSAILLAGLYADGPTTVVEPAPTRDHTERMLARRGRACPPAARARSSSSRPTRLEPLELDGPRRLLVRRAVRRRGDAAPGLGAARSTASTSTRRAPACSTCSSGWARASPVQPAERRRRAGGRPRGPLGRARRRPSVDAAEVPRLVDELPLFALAAAIARGKSVVRGAGELRVKETDRIETVTTALRALGVRIRATRRRLRGSRACRPARRWAHGRGRRPPDRDARRRRGPRLPRGRGGRGRRGGR